MKNKLNGRKWCVISVLIVMVFWQMYVAYWSFSQRNSPNDRRYNRNKDWIKYALIGLKILVICLIGGLYHALSSRKAYRIDCFLIVFVVCFILESIFLYWLQNIIGPVWGVSVTLWTILLCYSHVQANLIRYLDDAGYSFDEENEGKI